jgi:hypothetical protein
MKQYAARIRGVYQTGVYAELPDAGKRVIKPVELFISIRAVRFIG